MDDRLSFAGQVGRLSLPALLFSGVGAARAILYADLTLPLPGAALEPFLFAAGSLSAVALGLGNFAVRRRLAALARLERSSSPWAPQILAEALGEVAALPDHVFAVTFELWLGTTLLLALFCRIFVPGMGWMPAARLVGMGLLFGPVSALLAYLSTVQRVRRAIETLAAAGLAPTRVLSLLPVQRMQIRGRFAVLVAVTVLAPAVIAADITHSLAVRAVARVESVGDPASQRAAAETARWEVTLAGVGVIALVAAFALLAAFLSAGAVAEPMQRLADSAAQIAAGSMADPAIVPAEDEVWAVSAAFTTMQAQLVGALRELRRAGVQIGSTTEEIVATSSRYEAGAADQASSLNETSATTEELARSARQMAENATSVSALAQKTWESAQGAQQSAVAFAEAMGRMRQDNQAIAGAVGRLSLRVQQIWRIVEFINGVADKSDLLALNAELEGTKAGEVGRSFSLVAAEMRRLAENVLESTNEIEELIEEIRGATAATVDATEGGLRAAEGGSGIGEAVAESLLQITALAEQTSEAVK
ncbi:MAG TPA: methyl-accepting chemotaxis protein, partial [Myxococcaceae bacterium]|nr:methyl-accepting chemotaxis protein [Myxococcaceae bacterium]